MTLITTQQLRDLIDADGIQAVADLINGERLSRENAESLLKDTLVVGRKSFGSSFEESYYQS